ncbi:hypothetical protein [Wohlfahrtiimonas chitiniclastica]|uniref:hypothetical protein n=1 Tax=Wohlfahrtiimonas chitiniclastica TaxID=400946 RepID=UPI000B97D15C|nr:hypothetical protein [Wohlfahrtiimonas chitiniclastica]MBS7815931.1 hypothetical protein [Wohlfahrtiimonas chitiniclastica]MBS7822074.1 hypothetical protein [Wohlfahrtiimonas chitiniclastica]MBS7829866.1 hypothetical protein [Wohlfahrtiimonas chitiniclastica]MBS7831833.1 hypothetical protein [Wohlfahrtiimonas chitiniclastica]MBS7835144.1 hypothetical protein [Wohlfahrtiimonas chitiniclastica]
MSNAVKKERNTCVPERNRSIVARPRPAIGKDHSHMKQLEKAFNICYNNNKEGIKLLAKI